MTVNQSSQKRIHYQKKGIRVLGIAESYLKGSAKSVLAGVVMRRDKVIDGIVFGKTSIEGNDATDSIQSMYATLQRTDINCIILDGLIISMFNIVDANHLSIVTGLPVIAVTFDDSSGIEDSIRHRFNDWEERVEMYRGLGQRERVSLGTGKDLFIRYWKLEKSAATAILNSFTLQGSVPEPIRLAKLCARACAHALK
jgi:endonuclease V-like protein UPF0215 family